MVTSGTFGPELEIQMVRENLALAISYWTAVRKGQITPAHLPAQRDVVTTETGHVVEVFNPLRIRGQAELARCATNQVRGAFAFSAMQSHRTLESVCSGSPLSETEPGLRSARACIYLLDRSFRLGMLTPVWSCPPEYRQRFAVNSISFALDASQIDGQSIAWSDFGGLDKYLGLLEYCARYIERLPTVESPIPDQPEEDSAGDQPAQTSAPPPEIAHVESPPVASAPVENAPIDSAPVESDPAEDEGEPVAEVDGQASVSRFVTERCIVGPDLRTIASGLYAAYVDWCQETQQTPMAQRSFGMRLTGLGFTRRRRGRGRHWWEGLGAEGQQD
jgi:hypothetical protein